MLDMANWPTTVVNRVGGMRRALQHGRLGAFAIHDQQ